MLHNNPNDIIFMEQGEDGYHDINMVRLSQDKQSVSGDGTIATLSFRTSEEARGKSLSIAYELINKDHTFINKEKINEKFKSTGYDMDKKIVFSCGSGVTASVLWDPILAPQLWDRLRQDQAIVDEVSPSPSPSSSKEAKADVVDKFKTRTAEDNICR